MGAADKYAVDAAFRSWAMTAFRRGKRYSDNSENVV